MLTALRDTFTAKNTDGISRRDALRLGAGGVAAAVLSSLPFGRNAEAGEAKAATTETITDEQARAITAKAREMRHYSEDPSVQGVGVFINLQENAPADGGEKLGELLKNAFAKQGVPLDYRVNRSRGTATDITFYVRGVDFTIGLPDLKQRVGTVLSHHQGAWLPGQVSLNDRQPQ